MFNFNKIFPASSTEIVPLPSTSINWNIFSIELEFTEAPELRPVFSWAVLSSVSVLELRFLDERDDEDLLEEDELESDEEELADEAALLGRTDCLSDKHP